MNKKMVFSGTGGQGIVLLTRILGELLTQEGHKVISTETHGMATRGGSVVSFMKIGCFYSPLIKRKEADIGVVLHPDELPKTLFYMKDNGTILGYKIGDYENYHTINLEKIMEEENIPLKSANMVALGILLKIFHLNNKKALDLLKHIRKDTSENIKALMAGYMWEGSHVSTSY